VVIHNLENYILTERKRAGLSQQELAYLLGMKSSSTVSRCENFERSVSLDAAIALEVVFGVSIRELFAGRYEQVAKKTIDRVDCLGAKLSNAPQTRYTKHKVEVLLAALERSHSQNV
jgi:transcriptional regulator with XRE-family HTH domain